MREIDVSVRDVPDAEVYSACATNEHRYCPASQPNGVPLDGRCDCLCHSLRPPV